MEHTPTAPLSQPPARRPNGAESSRRSRNARKPLHPSTATLTCLSLPRLARSHKGWVHMERLLTNWNGL
eukprot:scaffold242520_cov36-Tisochrysis_lutea.AAC.1